MIIKPNTARAYRSCFLNLLKGDESLIDYGINQNVRLVTRRNYQSSKIEQTRKNDKLNQLAVPTHHKYDKLADYVKKVEVNNTSSATFHMDEVIKKPPGTHFQSGAIKGKPEVNKIGRFGVLFLVVSFIYIGGHISSLAAQLLHELEIFALPDDDDDDF